MDEKSSQWSPLDLYQPDPQPQKADQKEYNFSNTIEKLVEKGQKIEKEKLTPGQILENVNKIPPIPFDPNPADINNIKPNPHKIKEITQTLSAENALLKENQKLNECRQLWLKFCEINNLHYYKYPVFYNPHLYFFTYQGRLFSIFPFQRKGHNTTEISMDTFYYFFKELGIPYTRKKESEICLERIIRVLTALGKYVYKEQISCLIQQYSSTHHCSVEAISFIIGNCEYIDNNIVISPMLFSPVVPAQSSYILARKDIVDNLFKNANLPIDPAYLRSLFSAFRREKKAILSWSLGPVCDIQEKEDITDKETKKYKLPHALTYQRISRKLKWSIDAKGQSTQKEVKSQGFSLKGFFLSPNFGYTEDYVPLKFTNLLHWLTGGKERLIDELAKLVAKIVSSNTIDSNLTIFYSPYPVSDMNRFFNALFSEVIVDFCFRNTENKISFNKLVNKQTIKYLIIEKINGKALGLLQGSPFPSNKALPDLQKLISGKNIYVADLYVQKSVLRNTLHFIYLTNNYKEASSLVSQLSCNFINFAVPSMVHTVDRDNLELSFKEREWVYTCFAMHGLKLISEKQKIQTGSVPIQSVLKGFIKTCCVRKKDVSCTREELFDAFCRYYRHTVDQVVPLTMITFVKEMKQAAVESTFHYHKIHRYKETAHREFVGIRVNQQRLETYCSKPDNLCSLENTCEYLKKMNLFFP
ncbi:MAG: hypothetical protein E7476_00130 [Ruminococcaceae bacterium]|nr:hypothetical protein [Oscillospiraceae bacterium]